MSRRRDQALCDDFGVALCVEHRDQGFAHGEPSDHGGGIEGGVPAERIRRWRSSSLIGPTLAIAALTAFWSRGVKARKAC